MRKEIRKPEMKLVNTEDAAGHVICHDITIIKKDEIKDTAFRKGHIVQEEDIPKLLSIGKEHLYVWEKKEGILHEDEAAEYLAELCESDGMSRSSVKEGKLELLAEQEGLFVVDTKRLFAMNMQDDIMVATRPNYDAVKKGDKLAGMRIIPLVIRKEQLEDTKKAAGQTPICRILPFVYQKAGIVTTGGEVYKGRIQDTFTPVVIEKLSAYGIEVAAHEIVPDEKDKIVEAIQKVKEAGADMILCTGGMSVDPDDLTPGAISLCSEEIVTYGAPMLPGAMFLLAYQKDGTPIMGLPGCVMYARTTIFDVILPRVLAGMKLSKADFAALGCGGLCLGCKECHYPICGFGKGAPIWES